MIVKKIENQNGWIVFIVNGNEVVQVHSNGQLHRGSDNRGPEADLLKAICNSAMNNNLHSQTPIRGGVRWPQEGGGVYDSY